jgi:hypothetical protein
LILTETLSVEEILERVERVADVLSGYTEKLVFSYVDTEQYRTVRNNMHNSQVEYLPITEEKQVRIAMSLSRICKERCMRVATCAEKIDLKKYGIEHNRCIDVELMIRLYKDDKILMEFLGYNPDLFGESGKSNMKDKNQRKECGCIVSKDIGRYDTCPHLCVYCYANKSPQTVRNNNSKHDDDSESL